MGKTGHEWAAHALTTTIDHMQNLAPIHLLQRRDSPLDSWRGGYWGMFNIAAYTPLESLLLIQTLVTHGSVDPPAFARVSSLLTENSFIKDDDRYDEKRLSPGSLQELFLQILRDELKLEVENTDKSAPDGSLSPNKRRKLQAPSPHTLQEAHPYLPKVPALFDRLYSRYQEHQIRRIREDEERLDRVQSEIKALLEEEDRERKEKEAREAQRQRDAAVHKHVQPVSPEERRGNAPLPNGSGAAAGAGPALAPPLASTNQPGERPHPAAAATALPPRPPPPAAPAIKPTPGPNHQPSPVLKPAPPPTPATAGPTTTVPSPRPPAPAVPHFATPKRPPTTISPLPSSSPAPAPVRPADPPAGGAPAPLEPQSSTAAGQVSSPAPQAPPSALQQANAPPRRSSPAVVSQPIAPQPPPAATNAPPAAPPLVKPGVAPPSQFGQASAADAKQESARQVNGVIGPPVLQHPQGVAVSSPHPTSSPQTQSAQLGVLQRPDAVGKPKTSAPPQQATTPAPPGTPLKWEPPYKPPQPLTASQRPHVMPPVLGHHPQQHQNMIPQTWTPHTQAQVQAHAQAQAAAMHAHAQAQAVQAYVQAYPQASAQPQPKPQNPLLSGQAQASLPHQSPAQAPGRSIKPQQGPKPSPQPSHPVIFAHKPVLVPPQHSGQGQLHVHVDSKQPPISATASVQQPQRALQAQPSQSMPGQAIATPVHAAAAPSAHKPPVAISPTPAPTPTPAHSPKRISPTQSHPPHRVPNDTHTQPSKQPANHQQVYPNPQHPQQQPAVQQPNRPQPPHQQSIHPQAPARPTASVSASQVIQSVPAVSAPVKTGSPAPATRSPAVPSFGVLQPEGPKHYGTPYNTNKTPASAAPGNLKQQVSTPKPEAAPGNRWTPLLPQTPANVGDMGYFPRLGSATKWKSTPTPSTPNAVEASGMAAPTAESLSPVQSPATPVMATAPVDLSLEGLPNLAVSQPLPPKVGGKKQHVHKIETESQKARASRPPRSKTRDAASSSKEAAAQRQKSPVDESREAEKEPGSAKVKDEEETPRPLEETGDTTADESGPSQRHPAPSSTLSSRRGKRKRTESAGPDRADASPVPVPEATKEPATAAPTASITVIPRSEPPSHILWTRGFPRISSSALDQIGSHRHANMFAHQIRDRDAPGYKNIVLGPMDLKSIRAAINHGNKAAVQAAANLPDGDPGTSTVWLPISEDLAPPRGIINSAQLDRELAHMFANAVMYNPDPQRGFGPSFLRSDEDEDEAADEADASTAATGMPGTNVLGYKVDENAVVNDTRSMFVEVEKLLSNMRAAEISRGAPPPPPGATGLVSSTVQDEDTNGGAPPDGADDREGTAATDGDGAGSGTAGTGGTTKRRRITRG